MRQHHIRNLVLGASALALAGCGGGGTNHVASIPTPPPGGSTSPLPPAHLGLVSSAPFAVVAMGDANTADATPPAQEDVQFSYNASTNSYQISLPGFQAGRLTNTGYNGTAGQVATSTTSQVSVGSSATLQPVFVFLPVPGSHFSPYTYTSFGSWEGTTAGSTHTAGIFAYGIPTAAGDVPVTGGANYSAVINAVASGIPDFLVEGPVSLHFDFAGGTLSGSMDPEIADSFDGVFVDFGHYDFTQTVYSKGSTTFSGQLAQPGLSTNGVFNGNFTGPNAAELMARFQAPYLVSGSQGTLSGAWVGKKN